MDFATLQMRASCQATLDRAAVSGGLLAPWHFGQLPPAPAPGRRLWIGLLGPGVVLAGTFDRFGRVAFRPAVSAQ